MCRHRFIPFLALTFILGAVPARPCQAQWQADGAPVCTAASYQFFPTIASDGAGGAIITWYDGRSGNTHIYAQRLDAAGTPQWTANGVALCTAAGAQVVPTIASDGAGGAIVTWIDSRSLTSYDIYAQRVSAVGVPQWPANGVALCTAAGDQNNPMIVSDGSGGAIVTWEDPRDGGTSTMDIYAQRVSAAGMPQWPANGLALCAAGNRQLSPRIASDGAGGAIVTWKDNRVDPVYDIYAQRVNAAGAPQWPADGVALCSVVRAQDTPTIVSDGAGGAIVTWQDSRSPNAGIYAQRVNAAGVSQWTANGVALCTTTSGQPTIVSDGAGGAIVSWTDSRSLTGFDIYAQRVSAAGAPQWTANGVALCTFAGSQLFPTIASDGAGGAIVAWDDARGGSAVDDIYAQRVSAAGMPQWTADGAALCAAANDQKSPTIVSAGVGGAIVTWYDNRSGTTGSYYDIYAQGVNGAGGIAAVPPSSASAHFQLLAPFPNPWRDGQLRICFNLPSSERVSAEVFDLEGERARTLATDREFPAGTQTLGWDGRNDAGVSLPNGVYFVEVRVGTHSEARRAILLH